MTENIVDAKSLQSVLKLVHLVFDEISFKRLGFQQEAKELQNEISFSVNAGSPDNFYCATLGYHGHKDDEYDVVVRLTGYFEIVGEVDADIRQSLLETNTASILFPYLRSELTLITSQPETVPIIMQTMNINALLEQAEKNN